MIGSESDILTQIRDKRVNKQQTSATPWKIVRYDLLLKFEAAKAAGMFYRRLPAATQRR